MIKAFGALAAAGTLIKQLLQQVFLKLLLILQQVLDFSCSNYLLQFLYFKIDDLTYSIDGLLFRL
jgi:hypothetical protein